MAKSPKAKKENIPLIYTKCHFCGENKVVHEKGKGPSEAGKIISGHDFKISAEEREMILDCMARIDLAELEEAELCDNCWSMETVKELYLNLYDQAFDSSFSKADAIDRTIAHINILRQFRKEYYPVCREELIRELSLLMISER